MQRFPLRSARGFFTTTPKIVGKYGVYYATQADAPAMAVVVSAATAPHAVDRNRVKRRFRDICRRVCVSCSVVIVARSSARRAAYADLYADVVSCLNLAH